MAEVVLRGMTWAHARGFDPMVATSAAYAAAHPGVTISWEQRSLQGLRRPPDCRDGGAYDLMVIDHPHVGEVARAGLLVDLGAVGRDAEWRLWPPDRRRLAPVLRLRRRQWALAIDAATPWPATGLIC